MGLEKGRSDQQCIFQTNCEQALYSSPDRWRKGKLHKCLHFRYLHISEPGIQLKTVVVSRLQVEDKDLHFRSHSSGNMVSDLVLLQNTSTCISQMLNKHRQPLPPRYMYGEGSGWQHAWKTCLSTEWFSDDVTQNEQSSLKQSRDGDEIRYSKVSLIPRPPVW